MSAVTIVWIVLLALILVPLPLAWIIGAVLPDGYTKSQAQRVKQFFAREWKRIALCGVFMVLLFTFARDYALQVTLLGAAILIGRAVAVGRGR